MKFLERHNIEKAIVKRSKWDLLEVVKSVVESDQEKCFDYEFKVVRRFLKGEIHQLSYVSILHALAELDAIDEMWDLIDKHNLDPNVVGTWSYTKNSEENLACGLFNLAASLPENLALKILNEIEKRGIKYKKEDDCEISPVGVALQIAGHGHKEAPAPSLKVIKKLIALGCHPLESCISTSPPLLTKNIIKEGSSWMFSVVSEINVKYKKNWDEIGDFFVDYLVSLGRENISYKCNQGKNELCDLMLNEINSYRDHQYVWKMKNLLRDDQQDKIIEKSLDGLSMYWLMKDGVLDLLERAKKGDWLANNIEDRIISIWKGKCPVSNYSKEVRKDREKKRDYTLQQTFSHLLWMGGLENEKVANIEKDIGSKICSMHSLIGASEVKKMYKNKNFEYSDYIKRIFDAKNNEHKFVNHKHFFKSSKYLVKKWKDDREKRGLAYKIGKVDWISYENIHGLELDGLEELLKVVLFFDQEGLVKRAETLSDLNVIKLSLSNQLTYIPEKLKRLDMIEGALKVLEVATLSELITSTNRQMTKSL